MSVWHLDGEDEITDAVARLRDTDAERVILVVPGGSRIATGRINFRLLAREAAGRDKALAIVSQDEQVRSLATAAGVIAHATVAEAEAALERGDTPPEPAPSGGPDEGDARSGTITAEVEVATALAASGSDRRRRRTTALGLLIGVLVVAGIATLQVLPTADITIVPRVGSVGPIAVAVTAASGVEEVDVEAGEIPAVAIEIPLRVEGAFPAGGSEAVESRASGEVVFSSAEQSFDQDVAAGTRVLTADGVAFQTTEPVVLRRPPGGSGPSRVRAPVEAVEPGPDGNVPEGAIDVVPSLQSQGISVTNEEATSGGSRQETPIVTEEAYEAATVDLQNRLAGALATRLRDPESVPEGLTLFAETARLGPVTHRPEGDAVVGSRTDEFTLTSTATAQVLAVDEALVDEVAAARLAMEAPPGTALVAETVVTEAGEGTARGEIISYAAIAEGDAVVVVDREAVIERIAGLPVSEARSILEAFGTVTVTLWPDFLTDLPSDGGRITLDIEGPVGME